MNLAQAQAEMRKRNAKRRKVIRKAARSRPQLPRGVFVGPINRRKPVADFPELQRMLIAHLRSPKIRAGDFYKLLDIGTRLPRASRNVSASRRGSCRTRKICSLRPVRLSGAHTPDPFVR